MYTRKSTTKYLNLFGLNNNPYSLYIANDATETGLGDP